VKIEESQVKRLVLEVNDEELLALIKPIEFIITDNRGTPELHELYEALCALEG
jgi:hypothetical protein